MRLLLLVPTLDPSGAEKQLVLLARGLPRSAYTVHVCCLTRGGPYKRLLDEANIPCTVLHKRFKFDPLALARLKGLISDFEPDLLHTWLFAANAYGRLACGPAPRCPIIVSERCVDVWKAGWQHWLDRRLVQRTTAMVANSQAVASFYRERGFPAGRITVIPNGIDLPPNPPDRDRVRRDLGIPADVPVVLFTGRLARQKRIDDLLWSFELLRAVRGQVVFLIAGDGPERSRLQQFATRLSLDNHVRFLGTRVDVPDLLAASDLFWLASDYEGMSNSVMEAMAAGLPVIASDIPANRELVVSGETGFLVPVGDRAGFAQFAERVLFDRDLAVTLGLAGRERMATEFSVEAMVREHQALYERVLAARRPCAA